MNNSRNFRFVALLLAVSVPAVGVTHATYQDCQPGSVTTTTVGTQTINPNNGDITITTVMTITTADDSCITVEYSSSCALRTSTPKTMTTTAVVIQHADGTSESCTPTAESSGTRSKCL